MKESFSIFLHRLMHAIAAIALIMLTGVNTYSQSATQVYSDINKERLLLRATAQYIFTISQGQVDMDSAMLMTSRLYGHNRLLAYNEGYSDGELSAGARLLDAGKVKETKALLATLKGESRCRSLLELGTYFLFKSGNVAADLEEASVFLEQAIEQSKGIKSQHWKIAALTLKAFLLQQLRRMEESQALIGEAIKLSEASGNKKLLAQAHLNAALLLPFTHPLRMQELEKSLSMFQAIGSKEKEIEILSEITTEHFLSKRSTKAEEYLMKVLDIQLEIGYKHNQYVYDVLAYLATNRAQYTLALEYINKSLECIKSKADSTIAPLLYSRKANIYVAARRYDDALTWFDRSLEGKTKETRLFWFKAFLGKAYFLNHSGRAKEAMELLEATDKQFPPISLYEQMYFAHQKGDACAQLKKIDEAEASYNKFLAMAERFPPEYIHHEFPHALVTIAEFYFTMHDTKRARAIMEKSKNISNKTPSEKAAYFGALFKIDSAEQKYLSAFDNHYKWRMYHDSATNVEQRKKVEELVVQYETEKKDKDIQLLTQQSELQEARLNQSQFMRNIFIAGAVLFLLIASLLYYLYRTKQKSNKKLTHLLTEKEWLLKEVHHRVKNNLQTVLSLLESQSRQLSNEAFDALQESQNRVYAMSLIHKKLYQSTDISSINMEDYLRDLVQHLRDSLSGSNKIKYALQIDSIELDVSQAVPVGLIVNEAITNSVKYAFPLESESSQINISLSKVSEDKIVLLITDNGIGIPELKANVQSLGIKLMRGLTEDIEGTFKIEHQYGVTIMIEFVANVPFQKILKVPITQLATYVE